MESEMPTITIKEIAALSEAGRIAARSAAEFGQTAAGSHCAVSAERRVIVHVSPTGVGYVKNTDLIMHPAHGAGDGKVFFDPESGLVWWGSSWTLRILTSSEDPLESGEIIKDAGNVQYQRALMQGEA